MCLTVLFSLSASYKPVNCVLLNTYAQECRNQKQVFFTAQPSSSQVSPDGWQYNDHLWGPRSEAKEAESQEARRLKKI